MDKQEYLALLLSKVSINKGLFTVFKSYSFLQVQDWLTYKVCRKHTTLLKEKAKFTPKLVVTQLPSILV